MSASPVIRRAVPSDAHACVVLRGQTRENAISVERLHAYGITVESWAADIDSDALLGWVAHASDLLVGYGFGRAATGEVVVLALLPNAENKGLGKQLLSCVVDDLVAWGHTRLFLGCSTDRRSRSHGFYRHLGWCSTGTPDAHGDEILTLTPKVDAAPPAAVTTHASPEDLAIIDNGLGEANDAVAPLHEVRALTCVTRDIEGHVIGGAVGRSWGGLCELQQLWVAPLHRKQGLGAQLLRAFEREAAKRHCHTVYLETFSFQAPSFYGKLGFKVAYQLTGFPQGITKCHMTKSIAERP